MISIKKIIRQERFSDEVESTIKKIYLKDKITYPNLAGKNKGYCKFLLISTQRSGSSFLTTLFQSHPSIVCYTELLSINQCSFGYPFFFEENDKKMLLLRNKNIVRFIKKIIFRGYLDEFKAVGFKTHYDQLAYPLFEKAFRYLKKHKEIKIIHLIRKNFLQTLVSNELAVVTNQYFTTNPVITEKIINSGLLDKQFSYSVVEKDLENVCISLDFEKVRNYFEETERSIELYRNAFSLHEMKEIFYEDLIQNQQQVTETLLNFLGVENKTLSSVLLKQNTRTLSDVIINYKELEEKFRGSKWAWFFTESISPVIKQQEIPASKINVQFKK